MLIDHQRAVIQTAELIQTAKTPTEIAKLTARMLQFCGIFSFQQVGLELARLQVTALPEAE
jgi:hypothetical protein